LQTASNSARKRLQLRTTLNRINRQISTHPPADISELNRYTVSDRFLANILEHARDAIITTNNDGLIITWNSAAEKMFGHTQDEAVGRSIAEVAGGEWAELLPDFITQIRSTESGYSRQELVYERPDGRTLIVELMLSLVRDEPGEAIGMSAVVRDITERRNLENQFQQAQKMESLGILAGGIAHDFNNILTSVLISTELALLKLPPDSAARGYIEKVQISANLAAGLSNQMLAYSGKGHFLIQPLDLNQVIDEMAHLLHGSISKTAAIQFRLSPGLPAIEADVTQIHQVVMNLITNASEAIGSSSGLITITTDVLDCGDHDLSQTLLDEKLQPGKYVYLEVTDTGCGMDKETQSKIFDPFYTTKFTGRGLGLAAVLGIVRGHKAAITVQSEKGRGTTFKLLFPASDKIQVRTAKEPPRFENFQSEESILVIDDEENIREAVREILEMAGLHIFTAPDGQTGLELFKKIKNQLSLVILDLTMPYMSGEDVFEQMRQIKPEVPVLLTSGYSEQEIAPRFAGKGLAGFIKKPFNPIHLVNTVKQMLEQKG
jgi:PAS domain S-box-containing protein